MRYRIFNEIAHLVLDSLMRLLCEYTVPEGNKRRIHFKNAEVKNSFYVTAYAFAKVVVILWILLMKCAFRRKMLSIMNAALLFIWSMDDILEFRWKPEFSNIIIIIIYMKNILYAVIVYK